MGVLRRARAGLLCVVLAGACSVPAPADSPSPTHSVPPVESPVQLESPSLEAGSADASPSASIATLGDPNADLSGRGVEALGGGGADVVLRIGAPGYRLPEDERLYDLHGDRVLTTRADPEGGNAWMIVRDLDGNVLREFDTGMNVPQTGIIRGEYVYFGGIDMAEDPLDSIDLGAWVARGDAPLEPVLPPTAGLAIYQAFEVSPDGRTVGVTRSAENGATTYLIRDRTIIEVAKPLLLITMTNEVAVLIGAFSDITAFAIGDGAELWHAETDGFYGERFATSDGARIVNSIVEDAGNADGNSQDQLRIEVVDALTGAAEQVVLVPTERSPSPWLAPTLSSDRYAALLDTVLPNADEGPHAVQVVDLEVGELLEDELTLGDVPRP